MKTRISMTLLLAGAFFLFAVVSAQALVYTFDNITNNAAGDAAIGEAQLWVDVMDVGFNQALFTFGNTGPDYSSICDVYFDDGSLLGIAGLIDVDDGVGGNSGVDFTQFAMPYNLPGGQNIGFNTTAGFSADSDPPVQQNGVNPGETLGILFNLQLGQTWDNVIAELGTGALRIGIHVQGFESGGSESFVNNNPAPVPEPSTILLVGTGLLGIIGFGRKRLNKKA
jgi:hypothetical protein